MLLPPVHFHKACLKHWPPLPPPAGVVLPLLAQTILLWQVLLAATVLKKKLGVPQASRGWGLGVDVDADLVWILVSPCMPAGLCVWLS